MRIGVIGAGAMGSAIAKALATTHEVTVWNRSPDRAEALVGPTVSAAPTVGDAVELSELVIAVLTDTSATATALAPVGNWAGKTVLNLSTGTPTSAEQLHDQVNGAGGCYLDGAILALPKDMGSSDALILVAGPSESWAAWEEPLLPLGGACRHVSEQIGAADALDAALVGAFFTSSISAYVEALEFAGDYGIPAPTFAPIADRMIDKVRRSAGYAATAITDQRFESDQTTIDAYIAATRTFRSVMQDRGHRAAQLSAAVATLERASEAGYGQLGLYAQSKIARGD